MNSKGYIDRLFQDKSSLDSLPRELVQGLESIRDLDEILSEKSRLLSSIDDQLHKLDLAEQYAARERAILGKFTSRLTTSGSRTEISGAFLTQPNEDLLEHSLDETRDVSTIRDCGEDGMPETGNDGNGNGKDLIEMAPQPCSKDPEKDSGKLPELSAISKQNFIKRNKELLKDGQYFSAMTDTEKKRLERIMSNSRTVPAAQEKHEDGLDFYQNQDTNTEEETDNDLIYVNEFLPDELQAIQLDEINQKLRKISRRIFYLTDYVTEYRPWSAKTATTNQQPEISRAESRFGGSLISHVSKATTADEVMTKNFLETLHEFEANSKRLREIDEKLREIHKQNEMVGTDASIPPTKDELEKLIMIGLQDDFEIIANDHYSSNYENNEYSHEKQSMEISAA